MISMCGLPSEQMKETLGLNRYLTRSYPILSDLIGKFFKYLKEKVFFTNNIPGMNFYLDLED